jgi:cytochrome oxidase assembly protein ShyY1
VLRFLLSRRWLGLLLAVIVVGVACVELGRWQLRRSFERNDDNVVIARNLAASPAPAAAVLSTDRPPAADDAWRVVSAVGTYDVEQQLIVSYRTREGAPGVDVLVPLVTAAGPALLVDRGWVQTQGNANRAVAVPSPPSGTVTVTGWVRMNAEGDSDQVTPNEGTVRAISSTAIAPTLPYPVYDGFVDLTSEEPSVTPAPALVDPPDLGSGPHFFYGLQWFFFAVLAFGFWCYFAWSEYRRRNQPPAGAYRLRVKDPA